MLKNISGNFRIFQEQACHNQINDEKNMATKTGGIIKALQNIYVAITQWKICCTGVNCVHVNGALDNIENKEEEKISLSLNTFENIMENGAYALWSKCSIFHIIFKYMIFQSHLKPSLWSTNNTGQITNLLCCNPFWDLMEIDWTIT